MITKENFEIDYSESSIQDLEEIIALEHKVQERLKEEGHKDWFYGYSRDEYPDYINNGGRIYSAKFNNKIVSCLGLMQKYKWNPSYLASEKIIKRKYNISEENTLIVDFYFTDPEFRGNHLTKNLFNKFYLNYNNIEYIIALAHNDNTCSNKILKSLGCNIFDTVTIRNNLLRNIYINK